MYRRQPAAAVILNLMKKAQTGQSALHSLYYRKAKAPTSPKVGALPFSLSSHKENQ